MAVSRELGMSHGLGLSCGLGVLRGLGLSRGLDVLCELRRLLRVEEERGLTPVQLPRTGLMELADVGFDLFEVVVVLW